MSRFRRLLVLLPLLTVLGLLATPPKIAHADDVLPQVTVLPNGLTVATRERPDAEVLTVAVSVRAGGRYEPETLRGGSHLLEHMHFLGSERYPTPAAQFEPIARLGGDLNARTTTESTTYYATVPAGHFDVALDILADMLQRPLFPPDVVERERGVVQEELRGFSPNPLDIASAMLREVVLGPAGQDAGGTVASVGAIDIAELLRYRAERYTAANMVLAVVGPVRHADVVGMAGTAFVTLAPGVRQPAGPLPSASGVRIDGASPVGSVVVVGQRIPGWDSPDSAALLVLDGILDVPGTRMADALSEALRARGGTRIAQFADSGVWLAFAATTGSNADAVRATVQDQIRALQDRPVNPDELAAAKRYLAGRTRIGGDGVDRQALRLAELMLVGPYRTEEQEAQRILAVSAGDIQRVARAFLDPDAFNVVVLGRAQRGTP